MDDIQFFLQTHAKYFTFSLHRLHVGTQRHFIDVLMRLQFILLPPPRAKNSVLLVSEPNTLHLFSFTFIQNVWFYSPSSSSQVRVWRCSIIHNARCLFSLSLQPSNTSSLPLQQPTGKYANSEFSAGSLAITALLLYPFNCRGSCFLGDQTAGLPPGKLVSSPLAAAGKWRCFAMELNKGCLLIERIDSSLSVKASLLFCGCCCLWNMNDGTDCSERKKNKTS